MIISRPQNSSFTPVPAGAWTARCYRIIDLGTQKTAFKDAVKQVLIQWEIHDEDSNGNPLVTSNGDPLVISKYYSAWLSENSNLYKDLVGWRGREFTKAELSGEFDLDSMLGTWCSLAVIVTPKDGKEFSKVQNVNQVPAFKKKIGLPEGKNKLLIFDFDKPDMEVFESLSPKLKAKIEQSAEWAKLKSRETPKAPSKGSSKADPFDNLDDDVPF